MGGPGASKRPRPSSSAQSPPTSGNYVWSAALVIGLVAVLAFFATRDAAPAPVAPASAPQIFPAFADKRACGSCHGGWRRAIAANSCHNRAALADPELERWRIAMAQERDAILATSYPAARFNGRGIVLSAGGRCVAQCSWGVECRVSQLFC
jgi:hypothetical protein